MTNNSFRIVYLKGDGRPSIKEAPLKTVEQQGLQAIQRSRELLVRTRTVFSHMRGLLMEFGIVIPQGFAALHRQVPEILEDGDNELPDLYRPTLHLLYRRLCELRDDLKMKAPISARDR